MPCAIIDWSRPPAEVTPIEPTPILAVAAVPRVPRQEADPDPYREMLRRLAACAGRLDSLAAEVGAGNRALRSEVEKLLAARRAERERRGGD